MFKLVDKNTGYAIMNGITKKSLIFVPNGNCGVLRRYHIIDAVTIGKGDKQNFKTFILLEHDEMGEEDCVIVQLPKNGGLTMMIKENHANWRNTESEIAYFIHSSSIEVEQSYNGLDDLEDEGWELRDKNGEDFPDVHYWTEEEINDK